jgi:hypothetical protein
MKRKTFSLPYGLINILIYVEQSDCFPPPQNSKADIEFLRAANLAMQRKNGNKSIDHFLFIGVNFGDKEADAIRAYGFPNFDIVTHPLEDGADGTVFSKDYFDESIEESIKEWMASNHPGATVYPASEYNTDFFWWTGVEHDDHIFDWPFDSKDYSLELPDVHKNKAETWLSLLGHATKLEVEQATLEEKIGQNYAAELAATLCEWLHGFEAASGNSYNHFDPSSVVLSLGFSEFCLGYNVSHLTGYDLEEFFDIYDVGIDDMESTALKLITAERRNDMRSALSDFLGGDGFLLYVLHRSIWPHFSTPLSEDIDSVLNPLMEELDNDLLESWIYVSEGWCEKADE